MMLEPLIDDLELSDSTIGALKSLGIKYFSDIKKKNFTLFEISFGLSDDQFVELQWLLKEML